MRISYEQSLQPPRVDAKSRDRLSGVVAALAEYVPEALRVTKTPGVSIAISLPEAGLTWSGAFGHADLRQRRSMTPQTVFRAGSLSKLYTMTAVMQLVDDGILRLHAPVNDYLTAVEVVNPLGERSVTLYDLLTMRSGLATDTVDASLGPPPPLADYLRAQLAHGVRREYHGRDRHGRRLRRWTAKVGDRYQYSNFGVAILGLLVEDTNDEGLTFSDYVEQCVIRPLGMTSTVLADDMGSAEAPRQLRKCLATGYASFGDVCVPSPLVMSAVYPSLSLLTAPRDHIRWLEAMLMRGRRSGFQLLDGKTVDDILSPHVEHGTRRHDASWDASGLLVGLHRDVEPRRYFGARGAITYGWWSDSRAYPVLGLAITICSNRWDMTRWVVSPDSTAPGLVADFIASWFASQDTPRPLERPWRWQTSYVAGVLMIERLRALLGLHEPITSSMVDEMWSEAKRFDAADGSLTPLDRDGFQAGAHDMIAVPPNSMEVSAFLDSGRLRVPREVLRLVSLEFGRAGELAMPMPYFANGGA